MLKLHHTNIEKLWSADHIPQMQEKIYYRVHKFRESVPKYKYNFFAPLPSNSLNFIVWDQFSKAYYTAKSIFLDLV